MNEFRKKLYEMCDKTNTRKSGIDFLVNYYIESLHWSEEEACKYALSLFKNGTRLMFKGSKTGAYLTIEKAKGHPALFLDTRRKYGSKSQ